MKRQTQEPIKEILDQIDKDDHQERIAYLESHIGLLSSLDDFDKYYCTYHYLNSLHAVERYDDLLDQIDEVIEFIFINDVNYIPARTYEHLLYLKTEALYETVNYEAALGIAKQLIGMHPHDKRYRKMLEKVYRSYFSFSSANIKLAALILIFSSSMISGVFWYMTRSGNEQTVSFAFAIVIAPSVLAIALLGGTHLYHYLKSVRKTDELIRSKS